MEEGGAGKIPSGMEVVDNDNDNDTLSKGQPTSVRGLALQT